MKKWGTQICLFICIIAANVAIAQDPGDLLKGTKADANYLMEGYAAPVMNAFGTALNQGWYNTAKTHKKFGVDLTVSAIAIEIPSSDLFFKVNNNKLESIQLSKDHDGLVVNPGETGKVPTIFGPDKTSSQYTYVAPLTGTIDGIGGQIQPDDLPLNRIPSAVYNLGIGLPKNFDIKIRFIPTIGSGGNNASFFGIGVMHDIKQYIPGLKMTPIDLSAFVGYTKLSVNAELDDADPNKKGELDVNATTIQGLVSKKLSVFTFYGGVGYNFAKSNLAAKGNYDLDGESANGDEAKDPIDLSFSTNSFRGTVGMRIKLWVITFHGDYTFQKYNTFTAGFGISVR